jgi:polysaccharide pyruvyl transferase WcaK-like protein
MRVLVLWADDSSPNLGVRVLAQGTAALVRAAWPGAAVDVHNYGSRIAPVRLGAPRELLAEWMTRRHGLREWVQGYDLVVDTRSGDSFADIYGLPRLVQMTALAEYIRTCGVPLVLGPQTIGPFERRRGRALARRSMAAATVVMARDSASADYAERLGRRVDVRTTDVVFALPVPPRTQEHDVVLNVSGLLWHGSAHVDPDRYRSVVVDLHRELVARGRRVTLLAHVLHGSSTDDDVTAAHDFAAQVGGDPEVVFPGSLDDVRRTVAGARVVVGSRMHACLNALSVGTPAVPLAYSRKFAPLLGDLGWQLNVDLRSAADPAADVLAAIERAEESAPGLPDVHARARHLLDAAVAALRAVR